MFVPLDTKTVYTFLDSVVDLPTYVAKARELGYRHIGIMDCDNLYAAYHFIQIAQRAEVIPVLGIELSVTLAGQKLSLYLIAKNTKGYHNLIKISSHRMSGHSDWEYFRDFLEGVQVILPADLVTFAEGLTCDVMIGVREDSPQKDYAYPLIPLHTVRYFSNDDRETVQILHAIRDNIPLRETPPVKENQLLFAPEIMNRIFEERFPGALDNLSALVSEISYEFDTNLKLPRFNREKPAVEELREKAHTGLLEKGLTGSDYHERLEKELSVIHQMGFDDYFLIVWDLLRFGRSKGYYMGMGRGSAAGSLVSYALDITGIDPIKNHLIFERFLNEERYSMPDIDIDLPDAYRSDFLHYVRDRYGSSHTAQIVTFSTFGAKQAIRDVFKRFGSTEYELTAITKKFGFRDTLTSIYEKNISFRQLINSKVEYVKAYEIAKKIEGNPRQTSIHAAGVVMSDEQLTDHIPVKSGDDMLITQYDAGAVEANGLLKMDFLGLRNLTLVQKMRGKVQEEYGKTIDISSIDLEDKETLALFAEGRTKGIFQFEQQGAISLLKRVKPEKFEEVVATTSLNRPGASDYIDNFVNRKFGREKVDLIDPLIASILEPTYGIMLYQEQVMQIAQIYAGFSLGKADLLRRAMSKKDALEMKKMEEAFLSGAVKLGRPEATARLLFERMAKFAGYGFNRSHAYAYSALAFQLAYFKVHYTDVFYDVMLNDANANYISDALVAGFELGELDLNTVPYHDKISGDKVILGLKTVKGLSNDLALWLIENRPFRSIEDFLTRLPDKYHKVSYLLPLVQIGLFDSFEQNRRKIELNLEHLFTFVTELGSLFGDSSYHWLEVEDYSVSEKYQMEQELLGVGISPHPVISLRKTLGKKASLISDVTTNASHTILGQIEKIHQIRTQSKGELMAFVTITDGYAKMTVTVFPEEYKKWQESLVIGKIFFFTGKGQERSGDVQLILSGLSEASDEKFWLQLASHENDQAISSILQKYRGSIPVVLHYVDTKETLESQSYHVNKSQTMLDELAPLVMKTIFR